MEELIGIEEIVASIAEGKTKQIFPACRIDPDIVEICSKPIVTAGDGAKKDEIEGKDKLANNITSNVFELLNKYGIMTHFVKRASEISFFALKCEMLPVEVVIRRIATGSYLKRHSEVADGTVFDELVVEFFYKDDELEDPIIEISRGTWYLYKAHKPKNDLDSSIRCISPCLFPDEVDYIENQARMIFLILEQALRELGITLWDLKIEFGKHKNKFKLADVIDPDSFRIKDKNGKQLDKQVYRDGGSIREVKGIYEIVSELTNQW